MGICVWMLGNGVVNLQWSFSALSGAQNSIMHWFWFTDKNTALHVNTCGCTYGTHLPVCFNVQLQRKYTFETFGFLNRQKLMSIYSSDKNIKTNNKLYYHSTTLMQKSANPHACAKCLTALQSAIDSLFIYNS